MNKIKNSKCKIGNYKYEPRSEERMKLAEKLNLVLEDVTKLEKSIQELIREIEDYDLERLLKKIDAELMDVQHNLILAKRLVGGTAPRKKAR
jgi:predicted nuclease with TOPRIM domain